MLIHRFPIVTFFAYVVPMSARSCRFIVSQIDNHVDHIIHERVHYIRFRTAIDRLFTFVETPPQLLIAATPSTAAPPNIPAKHRTTVRPRANVNALCMLISNYCFVRVSLPFIIWDRYIRISDDNWKTNHLTASRVERKRQE